MRTVVAANTPDWVQLEMPIGQIKALFTIAHSEKLTIGQLAEMLILGQSATSILVERLVQQGLVQRVEDPADRRRTFVELTGGGLQLAVRLREGRRDRLHDWLVQLPEEDLSALVPGLGALARVTETGASGRTAAAQVVAEAVGKGDHATDQDAPTPGATAPDKHRGERENAVGV